MPSGVITNKFMDDELKRLGINKKDLEKKSSSGMGEHHPVEGLHLKKAKKKRKSEFNNKGPLPA